MKGGININSVFIHMTVSAWMLISFKDKRYGSFKTRSVVIIKQGQLISPIDSAVGNMHLFFLVVKGCYGIYLFQKDNHFMISSWIEHRHMHIIPLHIINNQMHQRCRRKDGWVLS